MKNHGKYLFVVTCLALSGLTNASYWKLRSMADAASGSITSGADVVRGSRVQANIGMPTGSVYGDGPFPFYGERDAMTKHIYIGNPGLMDYHAYADSYYTFVYEYIRTARAEEPPMPGSGGDVYGYSLERAESVFQASMLVDSCTLGEWQWSAVFNANALAMWTWLGVATYPYDGQSFTWPVSSGTDTITYNGDLFYVRPCVVGSGTVSLDASNKVIFTVTVLNSEMINISSYLTAPNWVTTIGFQNGGYLNCYKGGAQFLGYPIVP